MKKIEGKRVKDFKKIKKGRKKGHEREIITTVKERMINIGRKRRERRKSKTLKDKS